MDMFSVAGKSALVTGASSGLGASFARLLAERGAEVTLAARSVGALDELCAEIKASGGVAKTVRLDVGDAGSVKSAISDSDSVFDIVVNNAGISIAKPALETSETDWDAVMDINLKGVFLVASAAARRMRDEGRRGSIVNIASIAGLRVAGGLASYAASKAGVIQLTRALSLEWARYGIRVNAIAPGYIETNINRGFFDTEAGKAMIKRIPQRRLGTADDLAGALLLLCSDAGRYMTGSTVTVDGGHVNSPL